MKASDNQFPKLILTEGEAPATPDAGTVKVYAKADGLVYAMDDTGAETPLGGGSIPDAPSDGKLYGRKDGDWEEVTGGGATPTPENVQTGTSYTLALEDAFTMVAMDNAAANTITVPPNSSVAFPVGTRIDISQDGVGQTTIVAGPGVIIRTPETLKIRKRWGKATLIKRAANTWDLEGNLEAAP